MTTTVLAMLLAMATKVTVVAVVTETSGSSSHFIVEVQNTVAKVMIVTMATVIMCLNKNMR